MLRRFPWLSFPVLVGSVPACSLNFTCHELRQCALEGADAEPGDGAPRVTGSGTGGVWGSAGFAGNGTGTNPGSGGEARGVGGATAPLEDAGLDAEAPDDGSVVLRAVTFVGTPEWAVGEARAPAISGDGSKIAFASKFDGKAVQPFFHVWLSSAGAAPVRVDQREERVTGVDGEGVLPRLSEDGRFVAFRSTASGLAYGDDNGAADAFVFDTSTGSTTCLSKAGIAPGNGTTFDVAMSPDGQYAAFSSSSSNLVPDDTNGQSDVFVADAHGLSSPSAARMADGASSGVALGPSGIVAFRSAAANLLPGRHDEDEYDDVFVSSAGVLGKVSVALDDARPDGHSREPALTKQVVAFTSEATNLVRGDTNGNADVFVRDLALPVTVRVSVGLDGEQANGPSSAPSISADGRFVAFQSAASNLVVGDTNGVTDVFVHDRERLRTLRVSMSMDGSEGMAPSGAPRISADGRFVVFESQATMLDPAAKLAPEPAIFRIFRAEVF